MNRTLLTLLSLLILGCNSKTKANIESAESASTTLEDVVVTKVKDETQLDSAKLGINFKPKGNYTAITNSVKNDKTYFKRLYQSDKSKAIDTASKYLYSKLLNAMVPHWYGTTWNFNGHTNVPNDGEIACGYFVSTTLKHLGFNLNRYKMAQAAGLDEAKLLQSKSELKIYSNVTFKELKSKVNKVYSDGVYFVGLDNHVGYMVLIDKEIYFLHSSYCDNKVVIELAEPSPCFRSNLYVFAEITTNEDLIKSWILGERLNIPVN